MNYKHRSVFVSDVHLGSAGARATDLLDFLHHNSCQHLFLVGDIFDLWLMRGGVRWNKEYNELIRYLLKISNNGCIIYYIPGNHDEGIRHFTPVTFGHIHIVDQWTHVTATGNKVLVLHGDEADGVIKIHPNMAKLGTIAYDLLISVNIQINRVLSFFRLRHFSFSEYIKHKVKDAVKYINHFEEIIVDFAKKEDCSVVVCGHIHTAADKMIENIRYLNCGDWISNKTAVVESFAGELRLVRVC